MCELLFVNIAKLMLFLPLNNRLDLFLPTNSDGQKPVVVFVTGGAWIIG